MRSTWRPVRFGFSAKSSAAAPDTKGAAKDVPEA